MYLLTPRTHHIYPYDPYDTRCMRWWRHSNNNAAPLMIASMQGHEAVVAALLAKRANANLSCKFGSALSIAKQQGRTKVVALLEAHK